MTAVVMAKKKGTTDKRYAVDYRGLNLELLGNSMGVHRIDDLLDRWERHLGFLLHIWLQPSSLLVSSSARFGSLSSPSVSSSSSCNSSIARKILTESLASYLLSNLACLSLLLSLSLVLFLLFLVVVSSLLS